MTTKEIRVKVIEKLRSSLSEIQWTPSEWDAVESSIEDLADDILCVVREARDE